MTIYNNSSTDPSFQMTYVEKTRQVAGYHVATDEDLTGLNKYADTLVNVAQFYRRNLAFGRIIYLVKQDDQSQPPSAKVDGL